MIKSQESRVILPVAALLIFTTAIVGAQDSVRVESAPSISTESISQEASDSPLPSRTLAQLKESGRLHSSFRNNRSEPASTETPKPKLEVFRNEIKPTLEKACVRCHGEDAQQGNIRIDNLDPDLLHGNDVNWWLEVVHVLSNGEMPPADEAELTAEDRSKLIEWLSSEILVASEVRRAEQGHSSFRRMTRYEYNYALQDLFELQYNFASDLPPDSNSEYGFQNSSETLHMSAMQFAVYRELSLDALKKATVQGDQPSPIYWGGTMQDSSRLDWTKQDQELDRLREQHKDNPELLQKEIEKRTSNFYRKPGATHYKNLTNGKFARASWDYGEAKHAWKPIPNPPIVPVGIDQVAIIPPKQHLIIELGDTVPNKGSLRVRVRASRASGGNTRIPSLQLHFGWQASNDSEASVRISNRDIRVDALPEGPKFYQWDIPLSEVHPRNSVRGVWKMGDLPSPSEFIKLVNSSVSEGDIQIDFVEITAPVFDRWPPKSHSKIFFPSESESNEPVYANELLSRFMSRAWRRPANDLEVEQKLALFTKIRPQCRNFYEAITEVLSTVLSSPKFLYLARSDQQTENNTASQRDAFMRLADSELATRLSMFLWCSIPDDKLLQLAETGALKDNDVLASQVRRMLADPKAKRLTEHFVRQWLGMQLLDYLNIDRNVYPQFDPSLKEAMLFEPLAFFQEVMDKDSSVLDFLHADYTMVNERLANHYGLSGVHGNDFRRVPFDSDLRRGGLLTQAGLLAMNSDGKDSHPLKRGVWVLKNILNDPPPPPPPAVPVIDLADPEIAKLTLKQRMENHRNQAACMSCHAKIDPWGIAFENFDAVGSWRTEHSGKPIDASSLLFNRQKLDGIDGLKRYLLEHRQDQFVRAMVHKMLSYALGRPLTFGDRAGVDEIASDLRKEGDGLATMIKLIVTSELFQTR